MTDFTKVTEALETAKGIAWDGCHKIYVLMDDEQMDKMREYGYDPLITADTMTPLGMLNTVKAWYEDSCSLRFIDAVTTNKADPNAGFTSLIPQFSEEEE